MGHDSTERERSRSGTIVFPRGEPGRFTGYHKTVCAWLAVFFGVMTVIVLLTGDDTGSMSIEAMVFSAVVLGTTVSAAVSAFTAGKGYAATVVPGLLTSVGLLALGIWLLMMQFVGDDPDMIGVLFVAVGVVVVMTSIAAWMELRHPPSQSD